MKKEIRVKYEIFSNYNAHLLGVAQIGYKSDYSEIYNKSVNPEDLKFLKENKNLLKWGDGRTSKLTELFIFFPNYINLETKSEMITYFNFLNEAIEKKSFDKFKSKYQSFITNLKNWFSIKFDPNLFSYKYDIKRLSEIYLNNFDNFINGVWLIEKVKIQNKINILNNYLSKFNFIELWENLTKLNFKYDFYDIILSSGIKNGPTANSLGYEKNWFYYGSETDWFIQFICHETGTHILINLVKNLMPNQGINLFTDDFQIQYKAYENLCSFYNHFVLSNAGLEHNYKMKDYNEDSFLSIYNKLFSENNNISAEDLFNKGIDEYKRRTVA